MLLLVHVFMLVRLHTHIQTDYRYIGRQKDRDKAREKKAGEKGTVGVLEMLSQAIKKLGESTRAIQSSNRCVLYGFPP